MSNKIVSKFQTFLGWNPTPALLSKRALSYYLAANRGAMRLFQIRDTPLGGLNAQVPKFFGGGPYKIAKNRENLSTFLKIIIVDHMYS